MQYGDESEAEHIKPQNLSIMRKKYACARISFFTTCTHTHTRTSSLSLRSQIFTHAPPQRHTETPSDISSLIQPLIGFSHRAEGVMKDRSNKRQTGGGDKERWGSETRRGSRVESPFGRDL